uniref:Integrase_H2C2 domain-containing protein n=1 Tax=Anopheles christyi TaxID=43041 RepID=A0A182K5N4_9DIPT
DHHVTRLLIKHYHEKLHHTNSETLLNEIWQKYNIPRLRATLRKITNNCQICKERKATPYIPRMAPLPPARLAVGQRSFTHVGLDYFVPMTVKKWHIPSQLKVVFYVSDDLFLVEVHLLQYTAITEPIFEEPRLYSNIN